MAQTVMCQCVLPQHVNRLCHNWCCDDLALVKRSIYSWTTLPRSGLPFLSAYAPICTHIHPLHHCSVLLYELHSVQQNMDGPIWENPMLLDLVPPLWLSSELINTWWSIKTSKKSLRTRWTTLDFSQLMCTDFTWGATCPCGTTLLSSL